MKETGRIGSSFTFTEKESAEHWTHAAMGTYCHMVFGVRVEGPKNVFSRHCVGGDSTYLHSS